MDGAFCLPVKIILKGLPSSGNFKLLVFINDFINSSIVSGSKLIFESSLKKDLNKSFRSLSRPNSSKSVRGSWKKYFDSSIISLTELAPFAIRETASYPLFISLKSTPVIAFTF